MIVEYQKPNDIHTNVYIPNYCKSHFDNWKLLAPIVYKHLFIPISSAEVERSFGCYNNILTDKRQSFRRYLKIFDFPLFQFSVISY